MCVLFIVVVLGAFWQALHCGFVNFDDPVYFAANPQVKAGLTGHGVQWAFQTEYAENWHPLTWLSLMLDAELFGTGPFGPHMTNLIFHAANTILLFLLLNRMTGAYWSSAFATALFAIHPLRVESVAWISERKDVLSGLFFLLTLLSYTQFAAQSKVQSPKPKLFYGLTLLFFALGLMAKPMLVTLPFILLLLDWWPLNRLGFPMVRRLLLEKLPFLLLSVGSCVVTFLGQKQTVVALKWLPGQLRLENALIAYVTYLGQMLWPVKLSVLYPYPAVTQWLGFHGDSSRLPAVYPTAIPLAWEASLALGLLAGISILAVILRRQRPYLITGWFWYLGMLVPVIGIVQVGYQSHADRYTYLPQIGMCLMVAWSVRDLGVSWRYRRLVFGFAAVMVITALLVCSTRQISSWHDSLTLWRQAIANTSYNPIAQINLDIAYGDALDSDKGIQDAKQAITVMPNYAEAHFLLGSLLYKDKRLDEAAEHLQKAFEVRPNYPDAHNNLGNVFFAQGKLEKAVEEYQAAVQSEPDYLEAHYNLALVLGLQGRLDETAEQYRKCIELNPGYAAAHGNLANLLATQGKLAEAVQEYQRTIELLPDSAQAHFRFGQALQAQGKPEAAIAEYRKALKLDPRHLQARVSLAWLLATCSEVSLRNGQEAMKLAQEAGQLAGSESPQLLDTLAAAYAEAGQYDAAVETAKRALTLNATRNDKPLAEAIQTRLKLYEANSPYHETP